MSKPQGPGAIVLFSGGLDSTTALCWAWHKGLRPMALTVDYGQRHDREILSARAIARALAVPHYEVFLKLPWLRASSLVDKRQSIPDIPEELIGRHGLPSTYVPGRNTVLLSAALSLADAIGAGQVVFGANHSDYSGYPDCRPGFVKAFNQVARLGTKGDSRGRAIKVVAPLMRLKKAGIIRLARKVKAPLRLTWSCYRGGVKPCGRCDSCKLRAKGFREAGWPDPAL